MRNEDGLPGGAGTRPGRKLVYCALAWLLAGCATHDLPKVDESAVRAYASRGYASATTGSVTTTTHEWRIAGQDIRLVVAEPARRAGALPLVIYVPGLGEAAEAGERWRNAWAGAGYAVLSIQPLADDAGAWQSDLARDANFKALGTQRYAPAAMSLRVRMLSTVLDEAQRRGRAGDPEWQSVDWSRLALAGFDLGAYTAMTVAGERVPGAEDAAGRVSVRAVIALSPHANAAEPSPTTRYRGIRAPVLSVTSDVDGDLLGLVDDASSRDIPFEHLSAPGTSLLSLRGLPHADFSGTPTAREDAVDPGHVQRALRSVQSDGSGQRSRGRSRQSAIEGAGEDSGRGREGDGQRGPPLSPTELQMRRVAVQAVSTAFLDAALKGDPAARDWLANGASRWLGDLGELQRK